MRWKEWLLQPARRPYLAFSALAVMVMGPMLLPGYILTLDMVFTPELRWPAQLTNTAPFYAVLHLLDLVLPSDLLQKIILFGILLLSGLGGFRLVDSLKGRAKDYPHWLWISYASGFLYMVNPFAYSRFMAGQYLVLIGYALLPFFIRLVLRWVEDREAKTAAKIAFLGAIIAMFSIHSVGIMLVPLTVGFGLALWRARKTGGSKKLLVQAGVVGVIFLGLSSYWLLPLAMGRGTTATAVQHFSEADFEVFATTGGNALAKMISVMQLQGFWAEARNLFWLPQEVLAIWPLALLLLWVIVGTGVVQLWHRDRRVATFFGLTGLVGIIAASGVFQPMLTSIFPWFAGYREPQKFAALVVVAFMIFAAFGAVHILQKISAKQQPALSQAWLVLMLILPVLLTPTMFWGFYRQLTPRHYPADWAQLNQELQATGGQVLFLPWHQYMTFNFAGRIIVNPAEKYFDMPVIASDNPEIGTVAPTVPNDQKRQLEAILANTEQGSPDLAYQLKRHRIQYIVVAKEFDFERYRYLDSQADIEKVSETASLQLYRNKLFNEE